MKKDTRIRIDSRQLKVMQQMDKLINDIEKACLTAEASDCQGRLELRSAYEQAIRIRKLMEKHRFSVKELKRIAKTIVFFAELVRDFWEIVSSFFNDYKFPENYEYRVINKESTYQRRTYSEGFIIFIGCVS